MPDFQLLGAAIKLAGSKDSVVVRGAHNPLTYPEILVMQFLHGDDAVDEIEEVGTVQMHNNDLLHHMQLTYGKNVVTQVFPGARPHLPHRSDEYPKMRAKPPPARPPEAPPDIDPFAAAPAATSAPAPAAAKKRGE
jgi:hypothetical protein